MMDRENQVREGKDVDWGETETQLTWILVS